MIGLFACETAQLGKIEALNLENIVVEKGSINPTRYYFGHLMLRKQQDGQYIVNLASNESILYQRNTVANPSCYVTLGGSYFGYMPHTDDDCR